MSPWTHSTIKLPFWLDRQLFRLQGSKSPFLNIYIHVVILKKGQLYSEDQLIRLNYMYMFFWIT